VTWATPALAALVVLAACSGSTDSGPRPTAAPTQAADEAASLEDVDTTALMVSRGPFCDRVDPASVTRALGEQASDASAYRSGQRIKISDDVADVVHEFGCRWTAGDDTAEAWVFAPPITRKRAVELRRAALATTGCEEATGVPAFGLPSTTLTCRGGGGVEIRFQGLFGDAWLTCALKSPGRQPDELIDRAGRWCAAIAIGAAS
jgi:hypothetical protein